MLEFRHLITIFIFLILISAPSIAQKRAEISSDLLTYDFGIIPESEEGATYIFSIKNTGTEPLVISNVSASCGCTRPDWTKNPIEPGANGEVKVNYTSKGRPGPFYKSITVNSNAKNNRYTLYIKGTVAERQMVQTAIIYPYSAGDLKLETKTLSFNRVYPKEILEGVIRIKNEGTASINLKVEKNPEYLVVECNPKTLNPGETGEISTFLHSEKIKRMGHISTAFNLIAESTGAKKQEAVISLKANVIENFTRISPLEKAKAPVAQYSQTNLSFKKLQEKSSGIIPFIGGGKEYETLKITNTGRSTLIIYTISSDNELIEISGSKRDIKPEASAEYKVSIRSKELKAKLEDYIHIVSNDPNGPVKLIKVTAEF